MPLPMLPSGNVANNRDVPAPGVSSPMVPARCRLTAYKFPAASTAGPSISEVYSPAGVCCALSALAAQRTIANKSVAKSSVRIVPKLARRSDWAATMAYCGRGAKVDQTASRLHKRYPTVTLPPANRNHHAVSASHPAYDLRHRARRRRKNPHAPPRPRRRRSPFAVARQWHRSRCLLSLLAASVAAVRCAGVRFSQSWSEHASSAGASYLRAAGARSRTRHAGGNRAARQKADSWNFSFDVGTHGNEARDRGRLALGCARPVRSAQHAAARAPDLRRDGGLRKTADRLGESATPALQYR